MQFPLLFLFLFSLFTLSTDAKGNKPPHILVILTDDLGYSDVSYHLESHIPTPNIDFLAENGVKFRNFYSHSVCSASRSALLTGKYAFSTGIVGPLIGTSPFGVGGKELLISEYLKKMGKNGNDRDDHASDSGLAYSYRTALIGKYHLGFAKNEMLPNNKGFDHFFGLLGGGFGYYSKATPVGPRTIVDLFNDTLPVFENVTHATELFTKEAVSFINSIPLANDSNDEERMFLFLSYNAPHGPLESRYEDIRKCEDAGIRQKVRQMYCGLVVGVDEGMKNVTDALNERGMLDDIVIFFMSDNGGQPHLGGRNYPFRGAKHTAWEGGVHVPAFMFAGKNVNLPKKLQELHGKWYDGLVHISDIFPTIVALLKGDPNEIEFEFDGIDIGSESETRDQVMIELDIFMNMTAVRKGDWKLIVGYHGDSKLYEEPIEGEWMDGKDATIVDKLAEIVMDNVLDFFIPRLEKSIFMKEMVNVIRMRGNRYFNLNDYTPCHFAPDVICRTSLFNLKNDPSESNNLLLLNHRNIDDEVNEKYEELLSIIRRYQDILVKEKQVDWTLADLSVLPYLENLAIEEKSPWVYPRTWLEDEEEARPLNPKKPLVNALEHVIGTLLRIGFISVLLILMTTVSCANYWIRKIVAKRRTTIQISQESKEK